MGVFIAEIKEKKKRHENGNTILQNLWYTAKAVLIDKFMMIHNKDIHSHHFYSTQCWKSQPQQSEKKKEKASKLERKK